MISLLQLNPLAFQRLKSTGKCKFGLSEQLFDYDFPGHYCCQIKTILLVKMKKLASNDDNSRASAS